MRSKVFKQRLYVGGTEQKRVKLPDLQLYDGEIGKACTAFAETHVAEPRAQFRDYILKDPTSLAVMTTGGTLTYLAGSLFEPQTTKHLCQGVGGHLGEGATALMAETMLGLRGRIAHTAVSQGRMRAPDFVAIASLAELFQGPYTLQLRAWENSVASVRIPLPIEAKARRGTVRKMKSFLQEGALQQIISYWWAMCRPGGTKAVVGYGLATAFCHQDALMVHCLLRPKDSQARADLVDMLELDCPDKKSLSAVIDTEAGRTDVLDLLEGF